MVKKILSLAIICLFVMSGISYGTGNFGSPNTVILGPGMGGTGVTPVTEVIKVRYGRESKASSPSLSSGDVMVWDVTSGDGYTVSGCMLDFPTASSFAGVLVETVATAENSTIKGHGRNIAYIAVRGYCLAKIDSTGAIAGYSLSLNGATLPLSFRSGTTASPLSSDIGVSLLVPATTDGLTPVWLR